MEYVVNTIFTLAIYFYTHLKMQPFKYNYIYLYQLCLFVFMTEYIFIDLWRWNIINCLPQLIVSNMNGRWHNPLGAFNVTLNWSIRETEEKIKFKYKNCEKYHLFLSYLFPHFIWLAMLSIF